MENYGPRYPYPYPQYPYPAYPYPPAAPYRPPPPSSDQYPPPPYYPYPPPPPYATQPPYATPPLHQHASGSHSGPLDYPPQSSSSSPEYHRHSFDYQPSPYPSPYPPHLQGTYAPPPHYPYQEPSQYPPPPPPPETKPQDPPPPSKTQAYRRQDCLTSVPPPQDNVSNSSSSSSYPPVDDLLVGGLRISDKPHLSSWQTRPADLYGYPNSSFPSNSHLPILDRVDSSTCGYASSDSPHGADMRMTLFSKGSLKVLLLHGNLDIWIYHAKNLPNMDMFHKTLGDVFGGQLNRKITSDPYVSVSVAGAVIGRTYVMSNSENPVWMQHFYVPVAHHAPEVHFVVKDSDVVGSQLIGLVSIPVEQIYSGAKIEGTFPILSSNGKPCKPGANLSLSIQYTPMDKLSVYHHGVGAGPDYQGVPGTYFPLRKGGTVTLYQDAHVPEGMLPGIRLDNGMSYQHGKCWHDMFDAIRQARRLIYITGWSVWHKVRLVRDKVGPASACTLGELLRSKSQEGVRVLLLVWDDPTSRSILGYKTVSYLFFFIFLSNISFFFLFHI